MLLSVQTQFIARIKKDHVTEEGTSTNQSFNSHR